MNRLSFHDIYMRLAVSMSERSTCRRLKVGCVITSSNFYQVYASGFNGNARGAPNDCDRFGEEAVGNCGCIHAEQNAVTNNVADRSLEKIVFCTHLPCVTCAKFIINVGNVREVYYKSDYRKRDSLQWLHNAGIEVGHLYEEGLTPAKAKDKALVAAIEYGRTREQ